MKDFELALEQGGENEKQECFQGFPGDNPVFYN